MPRLARTSMLKVDSCCADDSITASATDTSRKQEKVQLSRCMERVQCLSWITHHHVSASLGSLPQLNHFESQCCSYPFLIILLLLTQVPSPRCCHATSE